MEMMEALINRSVACEQKLGYDCKRSRLLNTPVGDSDNFSPYGYWVSRQNKVMDYWAGSLPGNILILFSHNTLAQNILTF